MAMCRSDQELASYVDGSASSEQIVAWKSRSRRAINARFGWQGGGPRWTTSQSELLLYRYRHWIAPGVLSNSEAPRNRSYGSSTAERWRDQHDG